MRIFFVRSAYVSCCGHTLLTPVFTPGESCIYITVKAVREFKIIIWTGCYYKFCTFCQFQFRGIQCSVFLNNDCCASSWSCIGFIANCNRSNCFNICFELVFCDSLSCCKFMFCIIINSRNIYLFCIEGSLNRSIYTISVTDRQCMGTCCQCSCCNLTIYINNFCSVNGIFGRISIWKSAFQRNSCFCISCMDICNSRFHTSFGQNFLIINIKCNDSFISVICNTVDCLAHHRFIMFRWSRAVMNSFCKSSTPCQLITFPDIFQMVHTVFCLVCCVYSYTINFIFICINLCRKSLAVNVQLIITIGCFSFQYCCCFNSLFFSTFYITETKASILFYSKFFIIAWSFWQYIVRIRCIFNQRIFSCISLAACLISVCYCDRHRIIICHFFLIFQNRNITYLNRESNACNICSFRIYMISCISIHHTGCSGFIQCCRCKCINLYIIIL